VAPRVFATIRHSGVAAAALSFLWPGLGQGWAGAPRRAILWAAPMLLLLAIGILIIVAQGRLRTVLMIVQPGVLIPLLALNIGLLAYRLLAIVDAFRLAHRRWGPLRPGARSAVAATLLGILLGVTLLEHAVVGYVGFKAYDTAAAISHPFSTPTPIPTATLAPGETPGPTPVPTPVATPQPAWGDNGRLDLLLIGGDAGPGRWSLRTDTMIILSVDVATGRAAMFGVPRNMYNVPLPDGPASHFTCGCFPDLLNSLFTYAIAHPEIFPGSDSERGYRAVDEAIAKMTGLQIDGEVVVTLNGFIRIVDALGGVDMYVPTPLYDAQYPRPDGRGDVVLYIKAGQQHFDGWHALAYARSRHQDNDYNRMDRQQAVLRAMRQQLNPCALIPRIPELLDIAKDSLWTNIPLDKIAGVLEIGARVKPGSIARFQFWPPEIPEYLTVDGINKIRLMALNAFAQPPLPTPGQSTETTPAPGSGSIC
jgi:polyisoprenyl-teichoic acid--peptidoglycan teichoic acid transferase